MSDGRSLNHVAIVLGRLDPVFARGLVQVFSQEKRIDVLAVNLEKQSLEHVVARRQPSAVVLDDSTDARLLTRIRNRHPEITVLVVVRTQTRLCESFISSIGATSLPQGAPLAQFLAAVLCSPRGRASYEPEGINKHGEREANGLSKREAEVLTYLREDSSAAVIALRLGISVSTVRTHTRAIFRKLNVQSRTELMDG